MIAFLRGRILDKQPNLLIVDVQGVGYHVNVPLSTFYDAGEVGAEVALRIYTHVREEALQLYGFLTTLEQQIFERLIAISGIGPKLAVAVLSGIEPGELIAAMHRGDLARLTGIPGVGRKTAERMVLELKDRLAQLAVPAGAASADARRRRASGFATICSRRFRTWAIIGRWPRRRSTPRCRRPARRPSSRRSRLRSGS